MHQGEGLWWYAIRHADMQALAQHLTGCKSKHLQPYNHFGSHHSLHEALEQHVPT